MPDLLARANQLEQDAPTLYVPENESEKSIGQPYKPGEISPMPNKNPAEQYSPELLKHFPKAQRSGQGQAPFRLNLIDLPGQQESMTVLSAGPFESNSGAQPRHFNLMRKSSSNSLMNGVHNKQDVQDLLNLASDQGFGLGGKII